MAKFVPDTFTDRWVIFATHRAFRPHDPVLDKPQKVKDVTKLNGYNYSKTCPFCMGNEFMTPPEVDRWGKHDGDPVTQDVDWLVRVIPNKFPISDIHEVVIHGPDHLLDTHQLPADHSEAILRVYLKRYQALSQKGTVIIFNNKGKDSGESLIHPHSQIVVLPRQIKLDVLSLQPVNNIVEETSHYFVYCPDFSQWPYETWISLKKFHQPSFEDKGTSGFDSITDEELSELNLVLRKLLTTMETKFPNKSYNYYIHPYSPWYLRVIPRFVHRAGFELGTGIIVNVKDPAEAATELRT